MLDQAMWGSIVESRGAGVHLPLRDLNGDRLRAAVEHVMRPSMVAVADALGRAVRAERNAVEVAADIALAHATRRA
jgi:UDP:flavonoid glycosyltransferase YjiC (YdhE family)